MAGILKSSRSKKRDSATSLSASAKRAELMRSDIGAAEEIVKRMLRPRALPVYSPEERWALAILVAYFSVVQRARGKKSKGAAKAAAEDRRKQVFLLLDYFIEKRYRQKPNTNATVMKIIEWLDDWGIEASEPQVRRDIRAVLKSGPLPTW
jgi:hypothetical protein